MAKLFGADMTFDVEAMSDDELVTAVRDASPPDGADAVLEVCGVSSVVPVGIRMLRIGGRYILAGLINPGSTFEIDGSHLVHNWVTLKGIHNYHPRHLVQALEFVMANRTRYPFAEIVDSQFSLDQLGDAFEKAANYRVLRAAIVP